MRALDDVRFEVKVTNSGWRAELNDRIKWLKDYVAQNSKSADDIRVTITFKIKKDSP
jgi:hypothetical protein